MILRLAQIFVILIKETQFVNSQLPLEEYICKDKLPRKFIIRDILLIFLSWRMRQIQEPL
jgi:hypothetical protein